MKLEVFRDSISDRYRIEVSDVIGIRDSGIRDLGSGDRDPGIQGFRDPGIQGFRDSGIQRFRDSEIQGFRDSGIQGFRNSGIQGSRDLGFQNDGISWLRLGQAGGSCMAA